MYLRTTTLTIFCAFRTTGAAKNSRTEGRHVERLRRTSLAFRIQTDNTFLDRVPKFTYKTALDRLPRQIFFRGWRHVSTRMMKFSTRDGYLFWNSVEAIDPETGSAVRASSLLGLWNAVRNYRLRRGAGFRSVGSLSLRFRLGGLGFKFHLGVQHIFSSQSWKKHLDDLIFRCIMSKVLTITLLSL